MEALKLKTIDDLLMSPDERVELIGGEILRRPMARFAHGRAQNRTALTLGPFDAGDGSGGGGCLRLHRLALPSVCDQTEGR